MGNSVETPEWLKNAKWFIKLRWIAIFMALSATVSSHFFLKIPLPYHKLIILVLILLLINISYFVLIQTRIRLRNKFNFLHLRLFLNIQVSLDIAFLTGFLHYSGGIENPAIVFYIFHMVLSSILLPRTDSFMQTTFALIMFGILVALEYNETIPHNTINHHLSGLFESDIKYLAGAMGIFAVTSYLVVFLTSHVTQQLREHEQFLEKLNQEMNEKDRIKNEYVLRLTHDIKSYVSAIKGNLEVLNRKVYGEITPAYLPFLKNTNQVIKNLSHFIKDLLQLTRSKLIGGGTMENAKIESLVENVIDDISELANKKNIKINVSIEPGQKSLYVYALSVKEMLHNLIGNAIKYSPEKSQVEVEIKKINENFAQISVSDHGIGIPEEDLPYLFKEFFRAKNAKKEFEGTGLGLAIVKQITKNHGGKVRVKSKEGAGTTIIVTLPYTNNQ